MSIFSRLSIFKKPEHRRFDPIPRFYDPEKEYIEGKVKSAQSKKTDDYAYIKHNIRDGFRNNRAGFGTSRLNKKRGSNSTIRLIVILVLLVLITYILLTKYFLGIETLIN